MICPYDIINCRVNSTNSCTDNCSGLLLKISLPIISAGIIERKELRKVLRRWLNACLTTVKKSFSSQPNSLTLLRFSLITADFTFGGGLNTFS